MRNDLFFIDDSSSVFQSCGYIFSGQSRIVDQNGLDITSSGHHSRIFFTMIRVPRMQGFPLQISGSTLMRFILPL